MTDPSGNPPAPLRSPFSRVSGVSGVRPLRDAAPGGADTPLSRLLVGMIAGLLAGLVADQLGLVDLVPAFRREYFFLFPMAAGGLISLTRLRPLLWVACGLLCAMILVVACTPILRAPANALVRADPLQKADAVVPLTSGVLSDGDINEEGESRLLKAIEIINEGWTREIVVTIMPRPFFSGREDASEQLKAFGVRARLEAVGPVRTTHDEALMVAALARQRGWKRVIVVTSPMHTRRAAAVFRKTGLQVIVEPCTERDYNLSRLSTPGERIMACSSWLREVVGREVYRSRGWI